MNWQTKFFIPIFSWILLKADKWFGIKNRHLSDGYHSYDELYEFRMLYNAALFNEWAAAWREQKDAFHYSELATGLVKYDAHKSWRHHDGEECFGGGWFIVVAVLPTGQISNHYKAKYWDLFKVPEVEKAKYPFDGHTARDVAQRLSSVITNPPIVREVNFTTAVSEIRDLKEDYYKSFYKGIDADSFYDAFRTNQELVESRGADWDDFMALMDDAEVTGVIKWVDEPDFPGVEEPERKGMLTLTHVDQKGNGEHGWAGYVYMAVDGESKWMQIPFEQA